jgi:protein-L-isoaspartate(D-aspartate) O-methyltransferase
MAKIVSFSDAYASPRRDMVERQLRKRHIRSERVLEAMSEIPRHEFVPPESRDSAYEDRPLPIGEGQTISQPYMVASMTQTLELCGVERVLEIGTGSGYQAAVLSRMAAEVFTIESRTALALSARERLARLGYASVHVHAGDGTLGLPDLAPFDAILVAAAAPEIPAPLAAQLAEGGTLVIPIGGSDNQELVRARKRDGQLVLENLYPCRFVPLIGRHGWQADPR